MVSKTSRNTPPNFMKTRRIDYSSSRVYIHVSDLLMTYAFRNLRPGMKDLNMLDPKNGFFEKTHLYVIFKHLKSSFYNSPKDNSVLYLSGILLQRFGEFWGVCGGDVRDMFGRLRGGGILRRVLMVL